jgi:hypothetical protein
MYQMVTRCTKYQKLFQLATKYINIFQSKAPKKFTQIGNFGLKINHLATLTATTTSLRPNANNAIYAVLTRNGLASPIFTILFVGSDRKETHFACRTRRSQHGAKQSHFPKQQLNIQEPG